MDTLIHAFIALPLERELQEGLAALQQSLRGWAKATGQTLQTIPRRALSLPLMDLGEVPEAALEAVELALRQLSVRLGEARLQPGRLGAFPDHEHPRLIHLSLDDATGRLTDLQREVVTALSRFGFAIDPRPYVPHVPLAVVDAPTAPLPAEPARLGSAWARSLDLMRRDPRLGWSLGSRWPLSRGPRPADEGASPPDLLARLLDERLAERAQTQQRPPARRPRPAQPPGDTP